MPPEFVTAADVLERLRLDGTDVDAAYIAECTTAANELVAAEVRRSMTGADGEVDPVIALGPPYPATVWRAALGVAIRVYRFKDAESDVAEAWGDSGGALRIPRDPLAGYRDLLTPALHGGVWAPA
jgi:hypothetical protein